MNTNSIYSIREYFSLEIGHRLIQPRTDDQYLVSFPRSGNTWMRTMLAVLINPEAEGNPDFTRKKIPGVSIRNTQKIQGLSSPRIIKSHTWFRESIPRAVYLVRDGRDVLVSLYHYLITRQGKKQPFDEFVDDYFGGKLGQLWHKNVESWIMVGKKILGDDLLIIRFEELKRNPLNTLAQTARFFGVPQEESLLMQAIQAADLAKMRRIEIQRKGPIAEDNQSFYRGGRSGEWRDYFSPQLESRYTALSRRAMTLAGYRA